MSFLCAQPQLTCRFCRYGRKWKVFCLRALTPPTTSCRPPTVPSSSRTIRPERIRIPGLGLTPPIDDFIIHRRPSLHPTRPLHPPQQLISSATAPVDTSTIPRCRTQEHPPPSSIRLRRQPSRSSTTRHCRTAPSASAGRPGTGTAPKTVPYVPRNQ